MAKIDTQTWIPPGLEVVKAMRLARKTSIFDIPLTCTYLTSADLLTSS